MIDLSPMDSRPNREHIIEQKMRHLVDQLSWARSFLSSPRRLTLQWWDRPFLMSISGNHVREKVIPERYVRSRFITRRVALSGCESASYRAMHESSDAKRSPSRIPGEAPKGFSIPMVRGRHEENA